MRTTVYLGLIISVLSLIPAAAFAQKRFTLLTGWGGGKPEEICPKAAAIGFDEIIVWNRDPAYLRSLIGEAAKYNIGIYASVYLSDVKAWKKRHPDIPPPLQVMNEEENAVLQRLLADKTPQKGGYQFGGEPLAQCEVLIPEMLCFHHPQVKALLKDEIKDALAVSGLKGIAFDFFGYRNYRSCRCQYSMELFEASGVKSLDKFSLDTLVAFNNELAEYARTIKPGIKVATHVYPVFLPEPLYGNRLNVEYCGQTAAWYFYPFWSTEKIRSYARVIAGEAKKYFPNAEGVAMIGIHNRPETYGPVKTPERIAAELQAILNGGCDKVQVCSMLDVLNNETFAAVFKKFFGKTAR